MTPGEYKNQGQGLEIAYGFYPSPFGSYLLAVTTKGICGLIFLENNDRVAAVKAIKKRWPRSSVYENKEATEGYSREIETEFLQGKTVQHRYFLKGTAFQIKVWQALLRIPSGTLVSYRDVALMIGMPRSIRAVANAIANNAIAFLIPCHRVITSSGAPGGYRWGSERKSALIGWEASQTEKNLRLSA